jgi:hypothetical protein
MSPVRNIRKVFRSKPLIEGAGVHLPRKNCDGPLKNTKREHLSNTRILKPESLMKINDFLFFIIFHAKRRALRFQVISIFRA